MRIHDENSANEVHQEEQVYATYEREERNRILSMHDTTKKQTAWSKLFPPFTHTEGWELHTNVF